MTQMFVTLCMYKRGVLCQTLEKKKGLNTHKASGA